jgi:hypothetical protein
MKKLYTFMWNEEESQTQVSGPVSLRWFGFLKALFVQNIATRCFIPKIRF